MAPLDGYHSEWVKDLASDHFELIGDCYVHPNGASENRELIEQEDSAIEGSLPFELLGGRYLRNRGLPIRENIIVV